MEDARIDPRLFRNVLGQYPTGVCVVTSTESTGHRVGFVVGSFTSVSLDPPQVAFFPDKKSTTWPRIQETGRFCVNILAATQESVCRKFSAKGEDKFDGVSSRLSPLGSPIVDEVVAWVDCEIESVGETGDHFIVIGRVRHLDVESGDLPLLFFQGGYGRFAPHSLIAAYTPTGVSAEQLRTASRLRPTMEKVASDLSAHCVASAVVGGELIVLASAGSPDAQSRATLVGAHLPFTPPSTAAFAAWGSPEVQAQWLAAAQDPGRADEYSRQLARVRERGFSVGLDGAAQRRFAQALDRIAADPHAVDSEDLREVMRDLDYDPEAITPENESAIRVIAVPVFNAEGGFELAFTIYGFAKPHGSMGIHAHIARAVQAAHEATAELAAG